MPEFKITKSKFLEDSPNSFVSCIFHNIRCGEVIIEELDLLSSEVSFLQNGKLYRNGWVDVLRNHVRAWDSSYGVPEIESEELVLFDEEIFKK